MADISHIKGPDNTSYNIKDKNTQAMIAPKFGTVYPTDKGTYVINNNANNVPTLYKANKDTDNINFNSNDWDKVYLADDVKSKQDKIPNTVAKTVTFDVTPNGGEVKAKVYNRVLYVSGYMRFSSNQSANTQLLHISDVLLAMDVFESCFTDGSATVRFKLTTDGKLINENQYQANQWVSVSLTCLLA